jgi:hypothetical protein
MSAVLMLALLGYVKLMIVHSDWRVPLARIIHGAPY